MVSCFKYLKKIIIYDQYGEYKCNYWLFNKYILSIDIDLEIEIRGYGDNSWVNSLYSYLLENYKKEKKELKLIKEGFEDIRLYINNIF